MVCAAVVVCAGALVAVHVFGPPSEEERASASAGYDHALQLVNEANETVADMSELMGEDLDAKSVGRIRENLADQPNASRLLDQAQSELDAARPGLDSEQAAGAADTLQDAISARKQMLENGQVVLRAGVSAYGCRSEVEKLWKKLVASHSSLQKSASVIGSGTTKEVKAALKYDKAARRALQQASALVASLAVKAPNADLSVERDYVSCQLKVAGYAVASDRALLADRHAKAKKLNASYQSAEKEAMKAAKSLPSDTDALVKTIYYSFDTENLTVEDAESGYQAAAKRASADDRALAESVTAKES